MHKVTRSAALDGLRGVAILLVLAVHLSEGMQHATAPSHILFVIAQAGWVGVDLFFVLSGFLITRILLEAKSSNNYFRNFYARRVLRIFPLYYATLFALLVIFKTADSWYWLYGSNIRVAVHDAWMSGSGPHIDHFWSLAVEEQFYLVWPAIVYITDCKRLALVCMSLIVMAPALRVLLVLEHMKLAPYVLTPTRIDELAMGGLLAVIERRDGYRVGEVLAAKMLATISGTLIIVYTLCARKLDHHDPIVRSIGFSLIGVFFTCSLLCLRHSVRRHRAIVLDHPVLVFFGKYSYALYILHPLVLQQLDRVVSVRDFQHHLGELSGATAFFITATLPCLAAALVSWYLLERRCLQLKRYFEYG